MEKNIQLLADSSKIKNKNHTIIVISDVNNPSNYDLLDVHVSENPINAENFISILQNSLLKIEKRLSSVEVLITDAAAYNVCAFNILKTSYPNIHFITCYSHLLGNIVSKIPIFTLI